MAVSNGKKTDLQRVGMLSSLIEISMHVSPTLAFSSSGENGSRGGGMRGGEMLFSY